MNFRSWARAQLAGLAAALSALALLVLAFLGGGS